MTLGRRREAVEDEAFERPVPPPRGRRDGQGGLARWLIGLVAVGIFGGSVWYAYQRGTADAGSGLPPLIKADERPTKLRPDDPGGLQVPNRDKLVYDRLAGIAPDKRVERLLPPPEEPLAKPSAPAPEAEPVKEVTVAPTAAVPPAPVEAPKPAPQRAESLTLRLDPATREVRLPAAPEAPPAAAVQRAAAPVPPAAPASAADVDYGIQLAALRSADGVPSEWLRLKAAFGSILGKLDHRVVKADLGDRGVYHRIVATPFASEAAARAACDKLQALRQDCFVVKLD
jgi:hypothetical protein